MMCNRWKDCLNRDVKCDICMATSDIYNHYPLYKDTLTLEEFLNLFEMLAVRHHVTSIMLRAPLGFGLIFYFRDYETCLVSDSVLFISGKSSLVKLFDELEDIAIRFRKRLEKENKNEES